MCRFQTATTCITASFLILSSMLLAQGNWEDNLSNPQAWTTGNVGIGTSSPSSRLDVRGGSARFGNGVDYAQINASGNLSFAGAARYSVAANTHAFKAGGNSIGLYFNAASNRLEFTNASGIRMFSADIAGSSQGNGYFENDLNVNNDLFVTGNYVVEPNSYAFRAQSVDIGLYFNQAEGRIEFTDGSGLRMFSASISGVNAGDGYFEKDLSVNGSVNAATFVGDGSGLTNLPAATIWTEDGSDIYYDAGNVGINTSDPQASLEVFSFAGPPTLSTRTSSFLFGVNGLDIGGTEIESYTEDLPEPLPIYLNNSSAADVILAAGGGSVGVGVFPVPAGYRLAVDGNVICEEVQVELSEDWPDYVFEEDYPLMTLSEVEQHIVKNKRLPGIPSAGEVAGAGLAVGAMQARLLEKIEELTLYVIAQQKGMQQQQSELVHLQHVNERLNKRLSALELRLKEREGERMP